jgi:NAD(P)-dependent dehydrogenase (short-subunit alcohol dehydrogenase family)
MVGTFGHIGYPYMGAYCAAAHAVLGLTRTAALEEGINNIRVNAVCPGAVDTELLVRMMGGDRDAGLAIGDSTALGRVASAEDVAGAVMYLLSDAASYVSGSSIMLDGGT